MTVSNTPPVLHVHAVPLSQRCASKYVFVGKGTPFFSPFRHQPVCGSPCNHLQQYRDWLIARCLREDGFVDQLATLQGKTLLDADVRPSDPAYRGHAHVLAEFVGQLELPGPDRDFYSPRRQWRLDLEMKLAHTELDKLEAETMTQTELTIHLNRLAWLKKRAPVRYTLLDRRAYAIFANQKAQQQAQKPSVQPAAPSVAKKKPTTASTAIPASASASTKPVGSARVKKTPTAPPVYDLQLNAPCVIRIAA